MTSYDVCYIDAKTEVAQATTWTGPDGLAKALAFAQGLHDEGRATFIRERRDEPVTLNAMRERFGLPVNVDGYVFREWVINDLRGGYSPHGPADGAGVLTNG